MAVVPIVEGQENIVTRPTRFQRAVPPSGGIGGLYLIRIILSLEPDRASAPDSGGIGTTSETNLEIRLNPYQAGLLRDELSKVLGALGG